MLNERQLVELKNVFEKFTARDAEGFLRAASHALVDVGLDDLIEGLRGQSPILAIGGAIATMPSVACALPAPPDPMIPVVAVVPVDRTAPPSAAELIAVGPPVEVTDLQGRLATLAAENRALQDTICRLSREVEACRAPRTRSTQGEPPVAQVDAPQRELEKPPSRHGSGRAEAVTRALDCEDSLPADDLIGVDQIARALRCSKSTIRQQAKKSDFPKVVSKRGRAFLYRRAEIEAWIAQRPARSRRASVPQERSGARAGLLDARQIIGQAGITLSNFYGLCSTGKFPKATGKEGKRFLWPAAIVKQWLSARHAKPAPARVPGAPCCLNCQFSRGLPDGVRRRCKKTNGSYENLARSPRDHCSEYRPWKAHLKEDTDSAES